MKSFLGWVVVLGLVSIASAAEYARPELLVDADRLRERIWGHGREHFSPMGVVVIDVRHKLIRNADARSIGRWIDIGEWTADFSNGRGAPLWSERLSTIMQHPDQTVVVISETVDPSAARAWWILKYWGVKDARILNGGSRAWRATLGDSDLKLISYLEALPTKVRFVAKPHPERLATRAEMLGLAAGESPPTCLIDTRTESEVAGGVIPTSTHADWVRFVDPATGKMRSADELAVLLDEAGFNPDEPAIAYCRSGGRASVVAFAMELMGGKEVANYFGSWNDWTSDPAAPVAEPGATAE